MLFVSRAAALELETVKQSLELKLCLWGGAQIAALRAERDPAGAPRLDPDAALPAPAGDADELGHDRRRAEAGTVVVCTCLPHATGPARYEIT